MVTRMKWPDKEWDIVCMELYRTNPITAMSSQTMVGISKGDFIAAMQRVLPPDRWRASINMTVIRPKMLERFSVIKLDIQAAEIAKATAKAAEDKIKEERGKIQAQTDIFAPVLKLLAEQIFSQLQPMIEQYIIGRGSSGLGTVDKNEAVLSHHRQAEAAAPRIKKPKVGVLGLIPIQQQTLLKDYPAIDFSFVEDGNRTNEIRARFANCEVVFGLTTKMCHAAETTLRTMSVWERYQRVSGRGQSSVRRLLDHWIETRQK